VFRTLHLDAKFYLNVPAGDLFDALSCIGSVVSARQ